MWPTRRPKLRRVSWLSAPAIRTPYRLCGVELRPKAEPHCLLQAFVSLLNEALSGKKSNVSQEVKLSLVATWHAVALSTSAGDHAMQVRDQVQTDEFISLVLQGVAAATIPELLAACDSEKHKLTRSSILSAAVHWLRWGTDKGVRSNQRQTCVL